MASGNRDGHQTTDSGFNLTGQSSSFQTKNTDVFGSLASLEKKYNKNLVDRFSTNENFDCVHDTDRKDDCIDERSRERFKRPEFPVSRRRGDKHTLRFDLDAAKFGSWRGRQGWRDNRGRGRGRGFTPDYKVNPEKWTKYSLEDTEVAGNSANSRIAFGIIDKLRQRREEQEGKGSEPKADLSSKFVFSKAESSTTAETLTKVKGYGGVRKMEEYDFGQKVSRKRKAVDDSNQRVTENTDSVSLNHLEDSTEDRLTSVSNEVNDTEGVELASSESDSTGFKSFKKGKRKRHIRGRDAEPDDA